MSVLPVNYGKLENKCIHHAYAVYAFKYLALALSFKGEAGI